MLYATQTYTPESSLLESRIRRVPVSDTVTRSSGRSGSSSFCQRIRGSGSPRGARHPSNTSVPTGTSADRGCSRNSLPRTTTHRHVRDYALWNRIIIQRRSIVKSVWCFQRRLFVFLCLRVCQVVNVINFWTSKHRMMKLGDRCVVQKSRPSSNLGVIAPLGSNPQNVAFG